MRIPAGRFVMGCVEQDKFANANELPRVEMDVAAFEISKHPVAGADGLPLINVCWDEAAAWGGDDFRLPTEAEWEYVCRAGSDSPFPTGDLPDPAQVNFLYDERGTRVGPGRLLPNGWGAANAFGVHDMLGNVCEWVADSWRADLLGQAEDPSLKTLRGGAWDYMPRLLRCSWRDGAPRTVRRDNLGFRVVRATDGGSIS